MTLKYPFGQYEFAILETQFEISEKVLVVLLASKIDPPTLSFIVKNLYPVDGPGDLIDLIGAVTRCVERTDDRAHAGTRDGIHRYAVLLQHFENANMRAALCAAAAQYQANARSLRVGIRSETDYRQERHKDG